MINTTLITFISWLLLAGTYGKAKLQGRLTQTILLLIGDKILNVLYDGLTFQRLEKSKPLSKKAPLGSKSPEKNLRSEKLL